MNEPDENLDPGLMEAFQQLAKVPERDPGSAAAGKARFLAQAKLLAGTVSPPASARHRDWINPLRRKETNPMTTLTALFLIVSLFLGGTGLTAAAAQNSLPDQPLYAVKLAGEEVRSRFTVQQQSQIELALAFSDQRVQEAVRLAGEGSPVPQTLQDRLQQEYGTAFQLAAGMEDAQMNQELLRIRTRLQAQIAELDRLPARAPADPEISRLRSMLTTRLQLAKQSLSDPQEYRQQLRAGWELGPTGVPSPQPTAGAGLGNPWTTGTPTPGSGYGPGPGPEPTQTCTPQSGYRWMGTATSSGGGLSPTGAGPAPTQMAGNAGPGSGTQAGMGPGPQSTQPASTPEPQQPGPGGMGPGPQPTTAPGNGRAGG